MSYLFAHCYLLKSLPDISGWNMSKIQLINGLFYECKSLEKLPDISKWNIKMY